ncbi:MAG TPA: phospholipase A [Candidatus Methylomirabilis sp.]|nr:phospholipase A [Candidatus Methylomirabilis sp.]
MCVLPLALVVAGSLADAQEVTSTAVALSRAVAKGGTISVWLVILNTSDHPISHTFQSALDGRLRAGTTDQGVPLELRNPAEAGEVMIPAGGYVRREYAAALPEGLRGPVILSAEGVPANPVVVEMEKPQAVAAVPEAKPTAPPSPLPKSTDYDAEAFFREHVFGYEPAYFIAGTKSPNAKFQISFKYRFFSEHGSFVQKYPPLKGFHLAYTQTSLWDWNAPSAPFLDTSYKPEFFYAMERVDKGRWGEAVRLDLQGGGQHESNGKGGADSRSLNIVYVQPTFVVGKKGGLQLSLAPRLWAYVGSLDDNPDIARFRGYVGLRAVAGWADSLQLSASGRVGSAWDRGSLQLDLTYPLRLFTENFGLYLHLQYFWGYGETLLRYNDRTSSIRAGFSLYR